MTDPMHPPEDAAHREQEFGADPEVLRLAAKIFNLARQGDAATLAAYVDAGVAANLCNDKGDTLIMLAPTTATRKRSRRCWNVAPTPTRPTTAVRPLSRARCSRGSER